MGRLYLHHNSSKQTYRPDICLLISCLCRVFRWLSFFCFLNCYTPTNPRQQQQWGAKKDGESSCAYITVGTGIGVGLVVNGQAVHGLLHPEAGHLCLKRMAGDSFAGVDATFGGASVEGLSSTVALAARKVGTALKRRKAACVDRGVFCFVVSTVLVWESRTTYWYYSMRTSKKQQSCLLSSPVEQDFDYCRVGGVGEVRGQQ